MFADQQNRIDGQFIAAQGQCRADAREDRDVEFVGQLQTDVALVDLIDIEGSNLGAWGDEPVVGRKAPQELGDQHTGVTVRKEGGDDGGDAERITIHFTDADEGMMTRSPCDRIPAS